MAKLCFVLGAGGARGISHIGFLQAMEEGGIKPDFIAGCSMGSVVGACYAKGMSPKEMMEIVRGLKMKDIADASLFPFNKGGILRSVKLRNKLEEVIGDTKFCELKIPFECIAADIVTGKVITFKEGSVAEAVRASSSIPGVFKPVEKDDMVLVDGGMLMPLPLNCVKDFDADAIVVVDVLGGLNKYTKKGLFYHILRVVDANNYYLKKRHLHAYRHDILITPELGDMSQYKVEKLDFAYEQGYLAGVSNLKKIQKILENKKSVPKV